jgi:hypothetical protein
VAVMSLEAVASSAVRESYTAGGALRHRVSHNP